MIDIQSMGHGSRIVFRPADQRFSITVAPPRLLRRLQMRLVNRRAFRTNQSARRALDQNHFIDFQGDHDINGGRICTPRRIEQSSLVQISWKAVQHIPLSRVRLSQPQSHKMDDIFIRSVISGSDALFDLQTKRCASGDMISDNIARRNSGSPQLIGELLSLSSFAGTRRTQQYGAHYRMKPS